MNILIAVPTFENIQPEVFKAIYDLDKGEHTVRFDFFRGYDCAVARNVIAQAAINRRYDYVLMIDSDTLIPKDGLIHLLDPQEDIVLGICPKKNTKHKTSALMPLATPNKYICYDDISAERVELARGGCACMLVKVSVFETIPFPWFIHEMLHNGFVGSEGFYFCEKARERGFKVWGDTRVRCGHLARYYQYE